MKRILKALYAYLDTSNPYRTWFNRIGIILLIIIFALFLVAEAASHSAGFLFNYAMEQQSTLKGRITVNTISASISGYVDFTDLKWVDPDGKIILSIPNGSFRINPWDVILGKKLKTSSIKELTINDADITLFFDQNMHLDLVNQKESKSLEEEQNKADDDNPYKGKKDLTSRIKYLNIEGKKLDLKVNITNSRLTAIHNQHRYAMTNVNSTLIVKNNDKIDIKFSSGKFGGSAIGNGIILQGSINMKSDIPTLQIEMTLNDIQPSSLGFGSSIHDPITLAFRTTGLLTQPKAHGILSAKQLELPALTFTDLKGNIDYDNHILTFTNVTADVFKGKLDAHGTYNINSRAYHIEGIAKNLDAATAIKGGKLKTKVNANLFMESFGKRKDTHVWGDFLSGHGKYRILSFDFIKGRFDNTTNDLKFYDVIIKSTAGTFTTNSLEIKDKKLYLSDIWVVSPYTGQVYNLADSPFFDKNFGQIAQANMSEASNYIQSASDNSKNLSTTIEKTSDSMGDISTTSKAITNNIKSISHSIKNFALTL